MTVITAKEIGIRLTGDLRLCQHERAERPHSQDFSFPVLTDAFGRAFLALCAALLNGFAGDL